MRWWKGIFERDCMYAIISFSHHNTHVALREKLYFTDEETLQFLSIAHTIQEISEILLLSTCNRCEIYLYLNVSQDSEALLSTTHANTDSHQHVYDMQSKTPEYAICQKLITALAQYKSIDTQSLQNIAIIAFQSHAIHHVFCVASGLLSAVVGETQISGQLKSAYKLSYDNNFCSKSLTRLIHFAFRCAASVRNLTDISKNPVSVASVAVNMVLDFLQTMNTSHDINDYRHTKILIIGVGEMGVLCLKHLTKHAFNITICNRTKYKAEELLNSLGLQESVHILDFTALKHSLNDYDIVLSAVAGGAIIHANMLTPHTRVQLLLDLSMPRNCSFDNENLKALGFHNTTVTGIDDLKTKAQTHIHSRQESAKKAMEIVGQFVLNFEHWLTSLGSEPLIKTMRLQAKQASLKEINRAIKKGFIPEALRDNVTKLIHSAFNEFLHSPTMKIKAMAEDENSDSILESIANVFGTQDRILLNRYKCEYDNTKH